MGPKKSEVLSMTGFGAGEARSEAGRLGVEMRSVNHRYLDVNVKAPREYVSLEPKIVETIRTRMRRGKVDVFLSRTSDTAAPAAVTVNRELARGYLDALLSLQSQLGLPGEVGIGLIAAQREVLVAGGDHADPESDWPAIREALEKALESMFSMRRDEGRRLGQDVRTLAGTVRALAAEAEARAPAVVEEYRQRLQDRLSKLLGDQALEPSRLAQEVALLAERTDVHEELVRLSSHLDQLESILDQGGEMGRKLDFLLQELGREINTLGSKANDAELARIVVDLKSTAEKIREQIQNIE